MKTTAEFNSSNASWSSDEAVNRMFLRGVLSHMNHKLHVQGHLFLNELLDVLGISRTKEGATSGWTMNASGYIDMEISPNSETETIILDFVVEENIHEGLA